MYKIKYKPVEIPETNEIKGTGWLPPMPDLRDYTEENPEVSRMTEKLGTQDPTSIPTSVDLRQWCSDIEDQKSLGSCTANAAVGIVEYYENKAFGKHINGSRLFNYKLSRNLLGFTGDSGAYLRTAMAALVLGGLPPEKYWPYTDKPDEFDQEPPSWIFAVADNYESLSYFCHDPAGINKPPNDVLNSVKTYLAAGIPSMFGFYGFPSFDNANVKGGIPFPCPDEQAEWGHAIVAVGYDDNKKIKNTKCDKETTGALLIRNSWGKKWGDKGYGWMPYDYVLNNIASDFWSLLGMEWIETGEFGLEE